MSDLDHTRRPAGRLARRAGALAVAAVLATTLLPSPVVAQTDEGAGAPPAGTASTTGVPEITRNGDAWTVPFELLGFGPAIRLTGHVARRDFFVPVPEGTDLVSMQANLFVSSDVRDGFLEVRDGRGQVLGTLDLGAAVEDRQPPGRPISVSLAEAEVIDGFASLSLVARLRSIDDVCETAFVGAHIDLNDAAFTVAGTPTAPSTVGAFFPPMLSKLHLLTSDSPSVAEADAAIRVATSVQSRYRGQQVDIEVGPIASASLVSAANSPFERVVVIEPSGSGLSLGTTATGVSQLTLGGDADQLLKESKLLEGGLSTLGIGTNVGVLDLRDEGDLDRARFTLDELEFGSLRETGVGQLELTLDVSQWDLGGPIEGMEVTLVGTHTPTTGGIQATLEVLVNDVLVHTESLGDEGSFEATFQVDPNLMRRDNRITARVSHTPAGGECRLGVHPFVIQLDPGSFIDVDPGQGLPAGFTRFPQVLRDGFLVAFDSPDLVRIDAGVAMLGALQALASTPLQPQVVSVADAVSSDQPAIVISGAGGPIEQLSAPLEPAAFRIVDDGGAELLRLDVDQDFGALQGFREGGRDVLLLTYRSDPNRLTAVANALDDDPQGWFRLRGDLFVVPTSGDPVGLDIRGSQVTAEPITAPSSSLWDDYRAYILGALAILIIVFLAWAYPRVVRGQPEGA